MRKLFVQVSRVCRDRSSASAGAAFALAVGLICHVASERWVERDARQRFASHAANARANLENRIKSYSDLLRALGSTLRTNTSMTPQGFREYVAGLRLEEQFPAVRYLNYAEHVSERDLPSLQQRLLARYGPPFDGRTRWRYGAGRSAYEVVTLAEPGIVRNFSIGGDLARGAERSALLARSRDSGAILQSGEPVRGLSVPNDPIFGFRLPLYRVGLPVATTQQRRAAYFGTGGVIFSTRALVEGVLADLAVRHVRMTLVDISAEGQSAELPRVPGGRLLFDSSAGAPGAATADPDEVFSTTETIPFFNRRWSASFIVPRSVFYTRSERYFPKLAATAAALTAFLLYALFQSMSSARRRALALARTMTLNLRRLSARAEQVRENERQRIAREIHDDLGQNLLALRIEADMLSERTRQRHPRLHARAAGTRDQIDTTIRSVRQIINDLRPAVLDLGLAAALEWKVAEFTRCSGIPCQLVGHAGVAMGDQHATAFFRILQESLSNVLKHAHASAVRVELKATPGALSMTISDNGIGLPSHAGARPGAFGLIGIEERVTMLAGTCSFHGEPGLGTTISVTIPVATERTGVQPLLAGGAASGPGRMPLAAAADA